MILRETAEQGFDPEEETRRYSRTALIALGPAQHNLRCAESPGEVVCGQAEPEVASGNAESAEQWRCQQGVHATARRPATFVEAAANDEIRTVHAAFQQTEHLNACVAAIGWPNRDLLHRIAKGNGGFFPRQHEVRFARIGPPN